jgi:acetyl esterase
MRLIGSENRLVTSSKLFGARSVSDITSLIREYPLAWVLSGGGGDIFATQVPLVVEVGADGAAVKVLGHLARRNPQAAALQQDGRATALFTGPHGYISPSWFRDRTQAPTWNVTTVKVRLHVTVDDSSQCADIVLARLVEQMERGRPRAWNIADMGARYAQLRRGIVGFYGKVLDVDVKFKLGQNERPDVLADQVAGLETDGRGDLASWVREHNRDRAESRSPSPEKRNRPP